MSSMSSTYLQLKQPVYRYAIGGAALFVIILLILLSQTFSSVSVKGLVPPIPGANAHDVLDDIYNVTLGFQKVLAINLPERTDHRDAISLACAVSNISVDFINGVRGDTISDKAIPPGKPETMKPSAVGSWRAHMNAIENVVHNNLTSALIMEDDVDWDIRLRALLTNFAASSTALLTSSTSSLNFQDISKTASGQISPYGDDWDVLWLGHCGMSIPQEDVTEGIVVQYDDPSVPETRYLRSWEAGKPTPLQIYPNHTRVVVHEKEGVCSLAYAVSQSGARKLLYNLGLRLLDAPFDLMLRNFCEGTHGNEQQVCISVLPQLFDHHRSVGALGHDSDINDKSGFRDKAFTHNIRWSVQMNMQKILRGKTDYEDQYPDAT